MDKNILTTEQIESLCKRAFGNRVRIQSVQGLSGGTFNAAYRITLADQSNVVLRVAPPHTPETYWDEAFLMRREHFIQPFFAPLASLMPKTLFVDFTHQVIDRDYMFQSFIEGERWEDSVDELSAAESAILWEQFGGILKQIHHVTGDYFGLPLSGFQFPSWSETIVDRLERTLQTAQDRQLEIPQLRPILDFIQSHRQQLDEVRIPRLLHGDLWLFNILIRRGESKPAIVSILDADRAWWGDPLADWTMFILRHTHVEDGFAPFWRAYGVLEDTPGARFRATVYDAMHAGTAYLWAMQHSDEGTIERATGTLSDVADSLPALV